MSSPASRPPCSRPEKTKKPEPPDAAPGLRESDEDAELAAYNRYLASSTRRTVPNTGESPARARSVGRTRALGRAPCCEPRRSWTMQ